MRRRFKTGKVEILIWIVVLSILAWGLYGLITYGVARRKHPEKKDIEDDTKVICMPNGHQYYYIWRGGLHGGPALAPILNDDGKPAKCQAEKY